jgi:hypothetical protein
MSEDVPWGGLALGDITIFCTLFAPTANAPRDIHTSPDFIRLVYGAT